MASTIPVIVQGNSFSLAIPLQIYYINGDQMDLQDYSPDPTDEVSVQLKGSRRNYTYTPTITDNIAYIDLSGNELADNYAVVVSIVKANGQRLRSFRTDQFFIVESSDDLTPADIIEGLEENVIYLNSSIFVAGEDGRGIESIAKTSTAGLVDTYTITYTDNTTSTFNVTNGAAGADGATIASVEKTATVGKVDTYTITMTNGSTFDFEVTNGLDGVDLGLANIVNDLTTGGATNVLSAEQGKVVGTAMNGYDKSPAQITLTAIEQHDGKTINKSTGELVDASTAGASVLVYDISEWRKVYASGFYPSTTGTKTSIAFYNSSRSYLGYQEATASSPFTNKLVVPPSGTKYLYVFGNAQYPASATAVGDNIFRTLGYVADIYEDEVEVGVYKNYVKKYVNNTNGVLTDASNNSTNTKEFYLEYENAQYFIDGRVGSSGSPTCLVSYYDEQYNYLGYLFAGGTKRCCFHYQINPPQGAKIVRILGTDPDYLDEHAGNELIVPKLYVRRKKENIVAPQIFNAPIKTKGSSDPLKILLFGSSWFMDTWWYLNYMIASAGINAEIHAYYIGHSQFREWIELYDNDLTPFSGSEATRTASRHVSSNGAAWTTKTYRTNYTAQQFRDDFYADITAGDWDIIGFQQGARNAPHWLAFWKPYYKELLQIIKQNCAPNAIVAFNSTWAMANGNTAELAPFATQSEWQIANWEATKRFLLASGINNIAPNGKTMWNLRQSTLNNADDLATDGIHPDNGLPIYALGLTWFQTYVAPMYGIDGDTIDWLPTSSTPKASVSGSTYVSIDASQRTLVRQLVKQAMGNRFDFDQGAM